MGNNAINTNHVVGQQPDLGITNRGSDWYYTVAAIMGISTITIMALAFRKPQSHRIFHYITAAVTAIATIAYFAMGSNLGQVPIRPEFIRKYDPQVRPAGTREIFYARYIDWAFTTPLLLLDLLLTAGVPWPTIAATIFADEIMIACGLIGALTQTRYKWGFYAFGLAALFFIAYELLIDGRRHASALGGDAKKTYYTCGIFLIFLWFLYPIAWGLSEGGNVIHPDSESIFYGILDVLSKPVFGALLIWGHRRTDPRSLGMRIRQTHQFREKYPNADQNGVQPEGPGSNVGGHGNPGVAGAGDPNAPSHGVNV
ncbi:bacteriorhodopsin [Xylariaceae sp. FL1019]|nr:bacteriorhodopsin [Xylariaceae sp. FL1019]